MPCVISGLRITSDVLIGKSTWDALFQPPNFFSKYKYLISPCFVCLNVTLSLSSPGLYHFNVCVKVDAIKRLCFGSVAFDWWPVLDSNTYLPISTIQGGRKKLKLFTLEKKLNQYFWQVINKFSFIQQEKQQILYLL